MIKIQSTANLSSSQGVKCLGYGGAGAGKTMLCASAPRPIVLSAEKGLLSLRRFNVPFIQVTTVKELEEAHLWATKSAESRNFDTIALDSVSEIAEVVLAEEKSRNRDPRKAYGELETLMLTILRDFRDMPQKHVYFIAKQSYRDAGGNKVAGPSFPGQKLPDAAPYFFDQVFQVNVHVDADTKKELRALKCKADLFNEGKDRSGNLDIWEPYDLGAMFKKIMSN